MKTKFPKTIFVIFIALLFSAINAQTKTGVIQGTVVDHIGAVIPNAVIRADLIESKNGSFARTITSNERGGFKLVNLPFGKYELEIIGFERTIKKQIEVNSEKPIQADIIFSLDLEACSDEVSGEVLGFVSDEDRAEIIRQMAELFLKKHSNFLMDEQKKKIILSTENIKSEWLTEAKNQKVTLMKQSEIQALADSKKDFPYLKFTKFKVKNKCVSVSLDNIWAVGKNSGTGYLSGGGVTYEFRKVEGKWTGKFVIGWIS